MKPTQSNLRSPMLSSPCSPCDKLVTCVFFILHSQITTVFVLVIYGSCSSCPVTIAAEFWAWCVKTEINSPFFSLVDLDQGLWDGNGSLMGVFGLRKKEKLREAKRREANKHGFSQLMAIVGAYVGPLAVTDHFRLFLLPFSSSLCFEKSRYFSLLMQEVEYFSTCSSIQSKAIKTAKDHQKAAWQDHKNESTSAPEMAQFYFLPAMLP